MITINDKVKNHIAGQMHRDSIRMAIAGQLRKSVRKTSTRMPELVARTSNTAATQRRESVRVEPPRRTSFRAPNLNLHTGFKQINLNPKYDITKFDVNKAQQEFMDKKIKKTIEASVEK